MADIFISASDDDGAVVRRVAAALEAEGFSVKPGAEKTLASQRGKNATATLALWSTSSVRSRRARKKAAASLHEHGLIPVLIEDVDPPRGFRRLKTADLRGWSGDRRDPNWLLLVCELRGRTKASAPPAPIVQAPPPSAEVAEAPPPNLADSPPAPPRKRAAPAVILPIAIAAAAALSLFGYILSSNFLPKPGADRNAVAAEIAPADEPAASVAVAAGGALETPGIEPPADGLAPAMDLVDPAGQDAPLFAAEEEPSGDAIDAVADAAAAGGTEGETILAEESLPTEDPAESLAPGEPFKDCEDCPDMVVVAAGAFSMGSPDDETSRDPTEGPVIAVAIEKPFAIGRHEVTFAQWDACIAAGGCDGYEAPDPGWGRGDRPAVNVSWRDARAYVAWLSKATGATYRLPSEAEWEYVARAGGDAPFSFGRTLSPGQANYDAAFPYAGAPESMSPGGTLPVGSFDANSFGVYDMHGNVWEWTADCWHTDHMNARVDGSALEDDDCISRVAKGGAWNTGGWRLRSAHRIEGFETRRDYDNGFRVVRELD